MLESLVDDDELVVDVPVVVPVLISFAIGSDEETPEDVAIRRVLLDEVVECVPIRAGQNRWSEVGRGSERGFIRLGRIDSADERGPSIRRSVLR